MQSHKRPHELSDNFLKNLMNSEGVDHCRKPLKRSSEAAILANRVSLSSIHFFEKKKGSCNPLNAVRKPCPTAAHFTATGAFVNRLVETLI